MSWLVKAKLEKAHGKLLQVSYPSSLPAHADTTTVWLVRAVGGHNDAIEKQFNLIQGQ